MKRDMCREYLHGGVAERTYEGVSSIPRVLALTLYIYDICHSLIFAYLLPIVVHIFK